MTTSLLIILCLIVASAFFTASEIAFAASRRLKLQQLVDDGEVKAEQLLALKQHPGHFFTVVTIGLNAVAILAGVLGESALTPYIRDTLQIWLPANVLEQVSSVLSFVVVTALFVLFADLIPKRVAMMIPESLALVIVRPMRLLLLLCHPLVWMFNGLASAILRLFNLHGQHHDEITPDDVYAMVAAGAESGALRKQEHQLIENVFELDTRTVPSAMTARDSIIFLEHADDEQTIKSKISANPHSKFLVCEDVIDRVIGIVDSKDILLHIIQEQHISLRSETLLRTPLMIPDTLTLSETLDSFNASRQDFAVVLNEYALVVGIITLNDVMNTLMGDLVSPYMIEEQIIQRDAHSWLIDGTTPIDDVMRALDIDEFPHSENYETIAGFMMFTLRKIPKRTDFIQFAGYKFEVVDIDSYKIDQLLVTKTPTPVNPEVASDD